MSQHLATATLDGNPVEILAGFDRRLGDYFLQVIDERNDMLYTSLQEPLLDWSDIATLRAKVAELDLRLPTQLVDEVDVGAQRFLEVCVPGHHALHRHHLLPGAWAEGGAVSTRGGLQRPEHARLVRISVDFG